MQKICLTISKMTSRPNHPNYLKTLNRAYDSNIHFNVYRSLEGNNGHLYATGIDRALTCDYDWLVFLDDDACFDVESTFFSELPSPFFVGASGPVNDNECADRIYNKSMGRRWKDCTPHGCQAYSRRGLQALTPDMVNEISKLKWLGDFMIYLLIEQQCKTVLIKDEHFHHARSYGVSEAYNEAWKYKLVSIIEHDAEIITHVLSKYVGDSTSRRARRKLNAVRSEVIRKYELATAKR